VNYDDKEQDRALYEPPQLAVIDLRPEEAVLSHCKIAGSSGPVGAVCNVLIVSCQTVGS
jgi:hypothetical protein